MLRAGCAPAGGGRRVCPGALRRLDAWLDGRGLQDATLAAYLAELTSLRRIPDEEEPRDHGVEAVALEGDRAAPARLVAGGEDGRRGPPPGTAALGPGRARRWQALVVEARCAGADVADAADGDGILRHRPAWQDEPGGRGRGTCGS